MLDRPRDAAGPRGARLLAHLAEDEPHANAELICGMYLQDVARGHARCRLLEAHELGDAPAEGASRSPRPSVTRPPGLREAPAQVFDADGNAYRIAARTAEGGASLRWVARSPGEASDRAVVLSLRDVIARMQSYEPMRSMTVRTLSLQQDGVSATVLRGELARVLQSPIVLNRGLRELTLARVGGGELSMSEIATRCGRVKRDARGKESGETSWLARRLGLLPDGGQSAPTPWIHTDVLALIARRGLGVSPREVEVA